MKKKTLSPELLHKIDAYGVRKLSVRRPDLSLRQPAA